MRWMKLLVYAFLTVLQLSACAGEMSMPKEVNFMHDTDVTLIVFKGDGKNTSIGLARQTKMLTVKTDNFKVANSWDKISSFEYSANSNEYGNFILHRKVNNKPTELILGIISRKSWDKLVEYYGEELLFKETGRS